MIYFIGCNDQYVKIGVSDNPDSRLNDLQAGNPYDLMMLKIIDVSNKAEAYLHNKFSHLHHRGEWFNLTAELRDYIATESETDLSQFQHLPKPSHTRNPNGQNAKKRAAVLRWLQDDEGKQWTDNHIAKQCGVSNNMVRDVAFSLEQSGNYVRPTKRKYICKHGSVAWMETDNLIGQSLDNTYNGQYSLEEILQNV